MNEDDNNKEGHVKVYLFYIVLHNFDYDLDFDKYPGLVDEYVKEDLEEFGYHKSTEPEKYLYAFTTNEDHMREFMAMRNSKKFVLRVVDFTEENYEEFYNDYSLCALDLYDYRTSILQADGNYHLSGLKVISTYNEFLTVNYNENEIVSDALAKFFNKIKIKSDVYTSITDFMLIFNKKSINYLLVFEMVRVVCDYFQYEEVSELLPFHEFVEDRLAIFCMLFKNTFRKTPRKVKKERDESMDVLLQGGPEGYYS